MKQELFTPPLQRYGQTEHEYARELILLHKEVQAYQFLLDKPFLASSKDDHGYTLFHHAASEGLLTVLDALLSMGANPYLSDPESHCPLHWAIERNNIQVVDFYLSNNLKAPSEKKYHHPIRSPFSLTIQLANIVAAKKCLQLGFSGGSAQAPHDWAWAELARLARKNQWGYRGQKMLSTHERFELIDQFGTLFLEHGICPKEMNAEGFNAFLWATHYQNTLLLQWFFESQDTQQTLWQPPEFSPLMLAARNNNVSIVELLLDKRSHYDKKYFATDIYNAILLARTHANSQCLSLLEHALLDASIQTKQHSDHSDPKRL